MIRYDITEVIRLQRKTIAIQCDRCKKDYTDTLETQEFHHIRFSGGYGSVFGDMGMGGQVECDLCQHCLYELIGEIHRVVYHTPSGNLAPLTMYHLGNSWGENGKNIPPVECRMNPFDAIEWFDRECEIILKNFKLNPEGTPAFGVLFGTTSLVFNTEIPCGTLYLHYSSGESKTLQFDSDPASSNLDPLEELYEIITK